MHYLHRPRVIVSSIVFLILAGVLTYFAPGLTPWVPTGRLVVAVRAVPYLESDLTLTLGLDTMTLLQEENATQVSVLTRRVLFDPKSDAITVLLDTGVRAGAYTGFSVMLTSPELRNPWQGDVAPKSVSLLQEAVAFPIPYTVIEHETTVVLLSFETLQALHEQDGRTEYLPVVQAETRHGGSVGTSEVGDVRIEGGAISGSVTYGMDWDGRMRHNFRAGLNRPEPIVETTPVEIAEQASTSAETVPEAHSSSTPSDVESTSSPQSMEASSTPEE
jgi:hypothetical protein